MSDNTLVSAVGDLILQLCYICEIPPATAVTEYPEYPDYPEYPEYPFPAATATPQRSFNGPGPSARQALGSTDFLTLLSVPSGNYTTTCYPNPLCVLPIGNTKKYISMSKVTIELILHPPVYNTACVDGIWWLPQCISPRTRQGCNRVQNVPCV